MSLETETKKIANNLQQLTDAIVTLTAELQTFKGSTSTLQKIDTETTTKGAEIPGDRKPAEPIVVTPESVIPVVIENKTGVPVVANVVPINTEVVQGVVMDTGTRPMTMDEANAALQVVVAKMGDGGVAVRTLLQGHNAISMAQILPENYTSVVQEARNLLASAEQQ